MKTATAAKPARKPVASKTACRASGKTKPTAYGKKIADLLLALPRDMAIRGR